MMTFDQVLADKLAKWYVGEWPVGNLILCAIALLLSVVLCGAIGIERERRGRSAGLRTHLLVGVGSCMIMIISIYGFPMIYQGETLLTRDVARLAAQVITGVGFLGAGAIIHRNSGTKGLTTAATIWIVMAIGLACGSMNYFLAIGGTILIIVVLTLFRRMEFRINKKAPLIVVRVTKDAPVISKILDIAQRYDCSIEDLQVGLEDNGETEITFLAVSKANEAQTNELIGAIEKLEGVTHVNIINNHKY